MLMNREHISNIQTVEFVNKGFLKWWRPKTRPSCSLQYHFYHIWKALIWKSSFSDCKSHKLWGLPSYPERAGLPLRVEMLVHLKEQQNLPKYYTVSNKPSLQQTPPRDKEHTALGLPTLHFWFKPPLFLPATTPKTHISYLTTCRFSRKMTHSVCWGSFQVHVLVSGKRL